MIIKEYENKYCKDIIKLFYDTVHYVNSKDYTKEQLNVWATGNEDATAWDLSFNEHITYVALIDNMVVGFGDIDTNGYLDRLYVHKDFQGKGVGTALCNKLEASVNSSSITTFASITALPFFMNRGYKVVRENIVNRNGISLNNYFMKKYL